MLETCQECGTPLNLTKETEYRWCHAHRLARVRLLNISRALETLRRERYDPAVDDAGILKLPVDKL